LNERLKDTDAAEEQDGAEKPSDEPKVDNVEIVSRAFGRTDIYFMKYYTRQRKRRQRLKNILNGNWQMRQSPSGYDY
jgi:hypothetical protein